jgi:acyl-CoA thioesterase-2
MPDRPEDFAFPDSPVGRQARWYAELVDAYRRGEAPDLDVIAEHVVLDRAAVPEEAPEQRRVRLQMAAATMAERFLAVEDASPFQATFLVERRHGRRSRLTVAVEETPPHRIVSVALRDDVIDFGEATTPRRLDGTSTVELLPGLFGAVGPLGGYIGAIALRAVGLASKFSRPTSFTCHFLKPARPGAVAIEVESRRATRRAESLRATVLQDGEPVLDAIVWTTDDMSGFEHAMPMPDVPLPDEVRPMEELFVGSRDGTALGREIRPILDWTPSTPPPWRMKDWRDSPDGPPRLRRGWMRFPGAAMSGDPYLEAARLLMPVDSTTTEFAVGPRPTGPMGLVHMDTAVWFHDVSGADWMFFDGDSPGARDGLAWGRALIWAPDGRLLASACGRLIQRSLRPGA